MARIQRKAPKRIFYYLSLLGLLFLASPRPDVQSGDPVEPTLQKIKTPVKLLKSEYIQLLKTQAVERKRYYTNQAREKKDLKVLQKSEVTKLLEKHRKARSQFTTETHTGEERRAFYLGQRNEMAEFKKKQLENKIQLERDHKERLRDFLNEQKKQRRKMNEN